MKALPTPPPPPPHRLFLFRDFESVARNRGTECNRKNLPDIVSDVSLQDEMAEQIPSDISDYIDKIVQDDDDAEEEVGHFVSDKIRTLSIRFNNWLCFH